MDQEWQTNPATSSVLRAAIQLTAGQVAVLPWVASNLIRIQLDSLPEDADAAMVAVHALAASQRALGFCEDRVGLGPTTAMAIDNETSKQAMKTIAAGANQIGAVGPPGLQLLIESVLPPMHKAAQEFSGERLIHELTTWFLLALSVGPHNTGPDADVYRGILLAYPIPEEQMIGN
jgi:hypothetical protein